MKFIKWLTAFIVAVALLPAQESNPDIKILRVSVEGNIVTSEKIITYTAGLKENDVVKLAAFSKSIKRLWDLGLFNDIQIRLDEETPEGVAITIVVEESPVLGKVNYKGNKHLKARKLNEKISLKQGQRILPNTLPVVIKEIKKLYEEDGYLRAEVEAKLVEPGEKEKRDRKTAPITKNVVFTIKENKKVKIGKILFEGNNAFSDLRLRRILKETKQQRWYLFWRSHFEEKKFEEDKDLLASFYRNKGYRDFKVEADSIAYSSRKKMDILFKLYEGPRYKYRNFTWEGNTLYSVDRLEQLLDLNQGEFYSEEDFQIAVYERVQSLYMDKGYIYSQIVPQITPAGEDSLDIHFVITENHKVYVRNINISGNTKTHENVIRRELKIYPGDIFNRGKLIRSQREVWILNYFSNVLPDVIPVDEDEIDLEITVEEKSSDQANVNVGYNGEYGLTGGGGVSFTNFRGRGQSLNLSFNVGTNYSFYSNREPAKYRSFSIGFTDPMVMDTPNLIGFSLFYSFRGQSNNYYFPIDFTTKGGSTTWGRRFKWPDDYFRGHWNFRITRRDYEGAAEDISRYIGSTLAGDSTRATSSGLSITQVLTRDSRDRPEFTTMGSRVVWETTLSGGFLGGNEDYIKHMLNLDWYTPTFYKFVLVSSFKVGLLQKIVQRSDEQSLIPFDERFIMGGNGIPYGNMLRGYPDNSIGPLTSAGRPIGGNAMFRYNTEFRFPFSENPVVYGLLFAEMGNVWRTGDMIEPVNLKRTSGWNLKRSAGAGIRIFMPMVGMLGFDMGYGFDDISGDGKPEGWNYTITFGQQF